MNIKLDDSWKSHLNHHINSEQFKNLVDFIKTEYKNNICYPKGSLIFASMEEVEKLKMKEEREKDGHSSWKLFFTVASFMLLPLL